MKTPSVVALVIVLGCVLVGSGCGGSETTGGATPSGWVTFHGESISLALPSTFVGGDPSDPTVFAALQASAANDPVASQALGWKLALQSLQTVLKNGGIALYILGKPDADGHMTVVQAQKQPWDDTLRAWIDKRKTTFADHQWTVDSSTDDQAYLIEKWEGNDGPALRHWALRLADSYLYQVSCTFDSASDTALEAVFRTSAGTIVVSPR